MRKFYTTLCGMVLMMNLLQAQVKINEVYGGGGNSGAQWTHDFVELYNTGSTAVSLSGWSVQQASATGSTWNVTNLSGTIQPNGYYLVQMAAGAGAGSPLPTPDATGTAAMGATSGKILLCNVTTAQTGTNPSGANVVDKVGYGATANGFEGTGPTPAPSNSSSVQRSAPGFDTNNNNSDFATLTPPTPTNGGIDVLPPTINTLTPANNATGISPSIPTTVVFSEAIQKGSGNITLKKNSDNSVVFTVAVTSADVTVSGNTMSFMVQSLDFNTAYYVEMDAGVVKDNANNNFAGITGNGTWLFTTVAQPLGSVGTTYNFGTCGNYVFSGFTQYSHVGSQLWACTTFGRDAANPPLGSAPNGLQINGFSGTNVPNEDWLISPAFDLTGTTFPLLSFWSRTAFNGQPLKLRVSTNYPGTGNPNSYTWTDLNGKFPGQTSDSWTLSENINLSAYKTTNTYFAFVYTSTVDDGARWTLDDITVTNSPTPPPPSLTVSVSDVQFGFAPSGGSAVKSFTVTGNDITNDITLTTTGVFGLSTAAGGPFTSSITLPQAGANNAPTIVYAQYAPTQTDVTDLGTVTVSTTPVPDKTINLKGTSIDPAKTLEVVNWNIEWFGSTANGPTNDAQQQANVQTILQNLGADIYGLCEVVDETRLATVVSNLPGYAYVISNFGSHTNPNSPTPSTLAAAQKLAFVYKTSVFSNVTTQALLSQGINSVADITNPAYNYFSSGRFPYMMTADVTLNSVTKTVRFILVHAKANTSPTASSYARRKSSSDTLQFTLNNLYPTDNIVVLGDFNDDLDQTITAGIAPPTTSYSAFVNDATNFFSPTLALSLAGRKSTVSFNDMIDHVELSTEMKTYYMAGTANVLDDVTSLVSNYGSTTTDHYPIFTRYAFDAALLPVRLISFTATKENNNALLRWTVSGEENLDRYIVEHSSNANNWQPVAAVVARGNNAAGNFNYTATDVLGTTGVHYYRLKMVDKDGRFTYSPIRKLMQDAGIIYTLQPNPVKQQLTIGNGFSGQVEIYAANGQRVWAQTVAGTQANSSISVAALTSGIYTVKLVDREGAVQVSRLVKE
jgi:hypothetical protein